MSTAAPEIVAVPAFSDNYIWLLRDPASGAVAVVDPGDGTAALRAAEERGWRIGQVLTTHWHPDHTGGNLQVKEATGCTIHGPAAERDRIPGIDEELREGDRVRVGQLEAEVWEVPGHTLGHIAFVFREAGFAFVGDTLFVMGCGRLFEGTPAQMHASLQRLGTLGADTRLYCAHEYTLGNARFAAHAEPDNIAVRTRLTQVEALRDAGAMTVPTTVAEEWATNPFLRAKDVQELGSLRQAKDSFR
ncbi:hydroxyacylglutathione hydrolase [Sphingomonas arenae]|uniref:hydroxyacylglutathione hydrolase n=1 Tax=Sphingomonas arenae TaxID=2812555 RepID=UPI00196789E1